MKQVIDPKDLYQLIRWHQDSLYSHRWQMSSSAAFFEENTIKVLKHYRDIIAATPECQKSAVNPDE